MYLLILTITLPIAALVVGLGLGYAFGVARPRWLRNTHTREADNSTAEKDGIVLESIEVIATSIDPLGVPQQTTQLAETALSIPTVPTTADVIAFPAASANLAPLRTPERLRVADSELYTPLSLGGHSPQRTPFSSRVCSPMAHLGNLVRIAHHALDEIESRSVLHRLTSAETATFFPPSPTHLVFSPGVSQIDGGGGEGGGGGLAVPLAADEIHMDEIDLQEKIGGGAFGSVYKGQWRGAPVAVKYVVTRTDNHNSLGRAIREIMLSKKLSHPNVVQCFSWTVLSQPEDDGTPDKDTSPVVASSSQNKLPKRALNEAFSSAQENKQAAASALNAANSLDAIPAMWPGSHVNIEASRGLCGVKRRRTSEQTGGWTPSPTAEGLVQRMDSFNSEEGFGSPIKRNQGGGVQSVFHLEALSLEPSEALIAVVMEHCDLGSLHRALSRKAFLPSTKWPVRTVYRALLRTAAEIAKGLEYCHSLGIVHGDLKPGNVLLKTHRADRRGYVAKVADFGLSYYHIGDMHALGGSQREGGSAAYTAPEAFECPGSGGTAGDVYSFGIMMWCMYYCTDPYDGLLEAQVIHGVCEGWLRPRFDDACPSRYRMLAEKCWAQVATDRPKFSEVCKELVKIEMEFRSQSMHALMPRLGRPASAADAEQKAAAWVTDDVLPKACEA